MTAAAVEVDGLVFSLGGRPILDDVSFSIEAGQSLAVIGPNGAGKTTLLKCINRILRHSAGAIRVFGRSLDDFTQRELAKVVGYVPQADARYFPFRVREFILMGRYPHLSPFTSLTRSDNQAADEALDRTGLREFADRPMDTLSGGERQSVFVAAALAQGAQLLLLDEPATFLDYKHQVDVLALLRRLNREQGVTIVSVTHDVNSALVGAQKVLALKAGRICFSGTPTELLAGNVLEEVYDTSFKRVAVGALGTVVVRPTEFTR